MLSHHHVHFHPSRTRAKRHVAPSRGNVALATFPPPWPACGTWQPNQPNLRKKGGNVRYILGVSGRVIRSGSLEKLPFSLVPCKGEFGRGGMQLCRQVVKTWFFTQVGPIPRSLGTGRPAALEPSYQRVEAPSTVIPLPLLSFSPPPHTMAPAKGKGGKASSKKDAPPPPEPGTAAGSHTTPASD